MDIWDKIGDCTGWRSNINLKNQHKGKGGRSINKMLKVAQIENQDLSVYKLPKDINYSNINSDNFNFK